MHRGCYQDLLYNGDFQWFTNIDGTGLSSQIMPLAFEVFSKSSGGTGGGGAQDGCLLG